MQGSAQRRRKASQPATLASECSYSSRSREAPVSESELHAQGTLNHARSAADHARRGSDCGGRSAAQGCGDFAEVSVALARDRVREVGVVEEIEEVRPEAQVDSFRM